jgi:hypothetical protein
MSGTGYCFQICERESSAGRALPTNPFVAGVDGNDPRLIDVGGVLHSADHRHPLPPASARPETRPATLFSRDCLEVAEARC